MCEDAVDGEHLTRPGSSTPALPHTDRRDPHRLRPPPIYNCRPLKTHLETAQIFLPHISALCLGWVTMMGSLVSVWPSGARWVVGWGGLAQVGSHQHESVMASTATAVKLPAAKRQTAFNLHLLAVPLQPREHNEHKQVGGKWDKRGCNCVWNCNYCHHRPLSQGFSGSRCAKWGKTAIVWVDRSHFHRLLITESNWPTTAGAEP